MLSLLQTAKSSAHENRNPFDVERLHNFVALLSWSKDQNQWFHTVSEGHDGLRSQHPKKAVTESHQKLRPYLYLTDQTHMYMVHLTSILWKAVFALFDSTRCSVEQQGFDQHVICGSATKI